MSELLKDNPKDYLMSDFELKVNPATLNSEHDLHTYNQKLLECIKVLKNTLYDRCFNTSTPYSNPLLFKISRDNQRLRSENISMKSQIAVLIRYKDQNVGLTSELNLVKDTLAQYKILMEEGSKNRDDLWKELVRARNENSNLRREERQVKSKGSICLDHLKKINQLESSLKDISEENKAYQEKIITHVKNLRSKNDFLQKLKNSFSDQLTKLQTKRESISCDWFKNTCRLLDLDETLISNVEVLQPVIEPKKPLRKRNKSNVLTENNEAEEYISLNTFNEIFADLENCDPSSPGRSIQKDVSPQVKNRRGKTEQNNPLKKGKKKVSGNVTKDLFNSDSASESGPGDDEKITNSTFIDRLKDAPKALPEINISSYGGKMTFKQRRRCEKSSSKAVLIDESNSVPAAVEPIIVAEAKSIEIPKSLDENKNVEQIEMNNVPSSPPLEEEKKTVSVDIKVPAVEKEKDLDNSNFSQKPREIDKPTPAESEKGSMIEDTTPVEEANLIVEKEVVSSVEISNLTIAPFISKNEDSPPLDPQPAILPQDQLLQDDSEDESDTEIGLPCLEMMIKESVEIVADQTPEKMELNPPQILSPVEDRFVALVKQEPSSLVPEQISSPPREDSVDLDSPIFNAKKASNNRKSKPRDMPVTEPNVHPKKKARQKLPFDRILSLKYSKDDCNWLRSLMNFDVDRPSSAMVSSASKAKPLPLSSPVKKSQRQKDLRSRLLRQKR